MNDAEHAPLMTGFAADPVCPLPEYPRPQFERDSYLCLNGLWDYAITERTVPPEGFDGQILVPFSPEAPLSGVNVALSPKQTLWYRRFLTLPDGFVRGRILLNFGAVDQRCALYVGRRKVGAHLGGYLPFSFDITEFYSPGCELLLKVNDVSDTSWHATGKQCIKRGGIWYTPQSGIWQTVWCESVPDGHIRSLKITPLYDEAAVRVEADCAGLEEVFLRVLDGDGCVARGTLTKGAPCVMPIPDFKAWSPDSPFLYTLEAAGGQDAVKSYFGMRKFSIDRADDGYMRLFLNNAPLFHNGLLDQGYWPDGLYTPPSDAAMLSDIRAAKAMGFNMLRKHIKIEPARWYFHCDREGLLVWQDFVSGGRHVSLFYAAALPLSGRQIRDDRQYGRLGRRQKEGRAEFLAECRQTVATLYNCPCIGVWVPFNEGWGQFDAAKTCELVRSLDPTRIIDHASGWHDQGAGDLKSLHIYFRAIAFPPDARPVALTEFGGYALRLDGHCFNEREFGYKRFSDAAEYAAAVEELYRTQILPAKDKGLCAAVYTQLTDVEDELNGLITYDRKVCKLPDGLLDGLFSELYS